MPLIYDDEPGSWGRLSSNWPSIHDPNQSIRIRVIRENLVPYGSYVTVGEYLRLENQGYVDKVLKEVK